VPRYAQKRSPLPVEVPRQRRAACDAATLQRWKWSASARQEVPVHSCRRAADAAAGEAAAGAAHVPLPRGAGSWESANPRRRLFRRARGASASNPGFRSRTRRSSAATRRSGKTGEPALSFRESTNPPPGPGAASRLRQCARACTEHLDPRRRGGIRRGPRTRRGSRIPGSCPPLLSACLPVLSALLPWLSPTITHLLLPDSACAPATARPPAKPTQSAATAATAAPATTATAASATHAAKDGTEQKPLSSPVPCENKEHNRTEDEPDPDATEITIFVLRGLRELRHPRQRHALVIGNVLCQLPGRYADAAAVVALPEIGHQQAPGISRAGIVDHWLEAVANLYPVLPLVRRHEQHHTVVLLLLANAKLFEQIARILLNLFAVERLHRDNGHLRPGFLFKFRAHGFELRFRLRLNNAREVGDVAGGMNLPDILGAPGPARNEQEPHHQADSFCEVLLHLRGFAMRLSLFSAG